MLKVCQLVFSVHRLISVDLLLEILSLVEEWCEVYRVAVIEQARQVLDI